MLFVSGAASKQSGASANANASGGSGGSVASADSGSAEPPSTMLRHSLFIASSGMPTRKASADAKASVEAKAEHDHGADSKSDDEDAGNLHAASPLHVGWSCVFVRQ